MITRTPSRGESERRPRVFVARQLPGNAIDQLRDRAELRIWPESLPPPRSVLLDETRDSDGLITMLTERIDRELLDQAKKLRVVSNVAVGCDNIDVAACTERGILVGNTPGVLTETTADLAFGLILAAARRIPEAISFVREGKWRAWDPNAMLGQDVYGATLGIIGMGQIGQAVARRAAAFAMKILYSGKERPGIEKSVEARRVSQDELLQRADFISLHVPLTPQTRHLIGRAELAVMKPSAVLVNTSRGPVVDQLALIEALKLGRPGAAALDVTDPEPLRSDDPLLSMRNVIVLPHIGSASYRTRVRMVEMAVTNLLAGLEGRPLPHCANPEVQRSLPLIKGIRL